ncbi:MAG: hypothetical protein ACK4HV_07515 [Parachlamydiaceae bacterium]
MVNPIVQIIPQAIQRASGGACFMCSCPAVISLRASIAKHQQTALKNKLLYQASEKDFVTFGACFWHDSYLVRLRAVLLKNDYYFRVPK